MVARALEVAQQVVEPFGLGHKNRRAQERADIELGRALQFEQILSQQNAQYLVAFAVKHREPRVRGVDHGVHDVVQLSLDVDPVHAGGGDHHVACAHVGQTDHTFEHGAGFGADDLVVFGFCQGLDQLFGGVGTRV